MSIDTFAFLPGGGRVVVEGEAQDIARRVRDGDPTKGWEGDPSMRVFLSPYENLNGTKMKYMFEVWGLDRTGQPYLAVSSETCGPELIDKLMRADTRRRDVVGEAIAAQEKAYADADAKMREVNEEVADRLAFALQGDNAAHAGGKGRSTTISMPGG